MQPSIVLDNKFAFMKMKIAVLGAGMVGRAIATDLARNFDVTSFDRDQQQLQILHAQAALAVKQADLGITENFAGLLSDFDFVVSAVPGFMGFATLKAIIACGKNVVDISFCPEDVLILHELAVANKVTAIVDCGVAPGMSNLILGRYNEEMQVDTFHCMVGGLPKARKFPFEYKAPFSPVDVIEEYSRPARYVENGHLVCKPALSDAELVHFENLGTLESFNTDGLRSLMHTMPGIPNMKEKTLRYPGHIRLIEVLQAAGFFSDEPLQVNGTMVKPIDFTSQILFKEWRLQPGEPEFTLMKVSITGTKDKQPAWVEYLLYDEYDNATCTSSMSRTTAYTCTAAVNLLVNGMFDAKGVYPPELVGSKKACFDFVLKYLADRGVHYQVKGSL